jgi:hypothetical protein
MEMYFGCFLCFVVITHSVTTSILLIEHMCLYLRQCTLLEFRPYDIRLHVSCHIITQAHTRICFESIQLCLTQEAPSNCTHVQIMMQDELPPFLRVGR